MLCTLLAAFSLLGAFPIFGDGGLDLSPLLNLIPPPWNMVAIFGLGVLAKWLHSRVKPAPVPVPGPIPDPAPAPGPTPAPSSTPILDALRALLGNLFANHPPGKDIEPAQAVAIVQQVHALGK